MSPLPMKSSSGIRARFVSGINGAHAHPRAGSAASGPSAVLLLHGFPSCVFLAKDHADAGRGGVPRHRPDQRRDGRHHGWSANTTTTSGRFGAENAVRDGNWAGHGARYRSVASVVGTDFGASIAAWCALVRPDVFRSVALMSAPFAGPPDSVRARRVIRWRPPPPPSTRRCGAASSRKHSQWWYRPVCDAQNVALPAGCPRFLRAYFHHKTRTGKTPAPSLAAWSAESWRRCRLLHHGSRRRHADGGGEGDARRPQDMRLPLATDESDVYAGEYPARRLSERPQLYRSRSSGAFESECSCFRADDRRTSIFISQSDWGVFSDRERSNRMRHTACPRLVGCHCSRAGHRVQQGASTRVSELLLDFLRGQATRASTSANNPVVHGLRGPPGRAFRGIRHNARSSRELRACALCSTCGSEHLGRPRAGAAQ